MNKAELFLTHFFLANLLFSSVLLTPTLPSTELPKPQNWESSETYLTRETHPVFHSASLLFLYL